MPNKATYRKHVMNGATVTVIEEDENGNALRAFGSAVPSDSGAGYAPACIFQQTDAATAITTVYVNIGSTSSCNFDSINDASSIAAAGFTIPTSQTLAVTTADKLTVGGVIVPQSLVISGTIQPHASQTTYDLFYASGVGYTVEAVVATPCLVQGGALTAVISKAAGTTAPAAATTPLHSGTIDCNATAYTAQVLTLTATGADLILAATNRIGITFSAALSTGILAYSIKLKRS